MAPRFINPPTISKPPGYTHVVETTGPGRTIYIAGQLGIDPSGKMAADFRGQTVQAFENLKNALAAVGAEFKDVVKINSYLADIKDLPVLRDVRAGYLNAAALPASTTLGSLTFAREGALLEVEVIAVLPLKSAAKAKSKRGSARKGKVSARRKGR